MGKRYISSHEGWNSRLDELQAAVLRVKLKNLDKDNQFRKRNANKYFELLDSNVFSVPKIRQNSTHVFHLFVIKNSNRDELKKYLLDNNVQTTVQYPVPIHKQKYFENLLGECSLPITEKLSNEILSLPMYPELTLNSVYEVSRLLEAFIK